MSEVAALATLAEETMGRLRQIDLLLVAVGLLGPTSLDEVDPAGVEQVVTANFTGPAAAIAAFLPALRRQGSGRVVVLSSVAGLRVRRANFPYGAAKAGLDGFCQGLADALAGSGVEVLIVRPGFVRTKMTAGRRPQPLAVGPEKVAEGVVAALERHAPVVYVPALLGPLFVLARLAPRRLWRRIER